MNYKISFFLIVALTFLNSIGFAQGKTIKVKPAGEHAKIEVEEQNILIKQLKSENKDEQATAVEFILSNPNKVVPPILCKLSAILFDANRKEEAAYWFYIGRTRARYDANRSTDKTAAQAVSILTQNFGLKINQYGAEDLSNLKIITDKVILFLETNNEAYEHQWINLHGMGAFLNNEKELSKPKSEWPTIKKETIETAKNGFTELIKRISEHQYDQNHNSSISERELFSDNELLNKKDSLEKEMSYLKVNWFLEEVKEGKSYLPLRKLKDADLKKSWKTDQELSKHYKTFKESFKILENYKMKNSPEYSDLMLKLRAKEIQQDEYYKIHRSLMKKLKTEHPEDFPDLLGNHTEVIKNLWYQSGVFLLKKHKAANNLFPTDWLASQKISSSKLGTEYMDMERKLKSTVIELNSRGVN